MNKLILVFSLLMAATAAHADKLKVGFVVPLTGSADLMGTSLNGVVTLSKLQNVEPVFEDDRCEGKAAISAYLKLRNDGVHVFYMACSGSIMAVAPLAKRNGDLVLTTYAGSSKIRETGDEVIRLNPDSISVADGVTKLITQPLQPIALLYEEQDYASSFADRLITNLGANVIEKISYRPDATSLNSEILRIKSKNPKSLVLVPVGDGAARMVLKGLSQNGVTVPIIGEVNLCDYPFKPSEFGLHGSCVSAKFQSMSFNKFLSDYGHLVGHPPAYPFYDAMALDLLQFLDGLATVDYDVPSLKRKLLAGFQGTFADYRLTADGEPQSSENYLVTAAY